MNKLVVGVLVAAIVGGGAFFVLNNDNDSTNNESANSQSSETEKQSRASGFAPEITSGKPFIATMTSTGTESEGLNGTIESDGQGNSHFKGMTAGQESEFFISKEGSYIFCSAGTCFKTSSAQGAPANDDFNLSAADVANYQSSAKKLTDESCPSGMCNVWEVSDEGVATKVYIDKKTNYVSQVVGQDGETTFKMIYEYKDVTITLPQNVQEFPTTPVQ